jgi:hypothetical protein
MLASTMSGLRLWSMDHPTRLATLECWRWGHIVLSLIGDRADYFTAAKVKMTLEPQASASRWNHGEEFGKHLFWGSGFKKRGEGCCIESMTYGAER